MRQILLHQTTTDKKDPAKVVHLDPYTILDDKGTVKDEDFILVGFVKDKLFKHIDVDYQTFYNNPYMAVGKYAIFANKNGEWLADKYLISDAIIVAE